MSENDEQMLKDNARMKEELIRYRAAEQRYIEKIVLLESQVRDFRDIAMNLSLALSRPSPPVAR